jgi:hypothetical protein
VEYFFEAVVMPLRPPTLVLTVDEGTPCNVQVNVIGDCDCTLGLSDIIGSNLLLSDGLLQTLSACEVSDQEVIDKSVWGDEGLAARGNGVLNLLVGAENAAEICRWGEQWEREYGSEALFAIFAGSLQMHWESLYFPYQTPIVASELAVKHFLGLRFKLVRVLYPASVGSVGTNQRTVGVVMKAGLGRLEEEWESIRDSVGRLGLQAERFADLADSRRDERLANVREFIERLDMAALHFGCHAAVNEKIPLWSYLRVGEELVVRLLDFHTGDTLRLNNLIVTVLNACETGFGHPGELVGFVRAFGNAGSRSVIATQCGIPNGVAADFASALWGELSNGVDVVTAKHAAGSRAGNLRLALASLAYGVYGDSDATVGFASYAGFGF